MTAYKAPMKFHQLKDFLVSKMRMSHIYQPVMIKTLIETGGRSSTAEIARALLSYDVSQQEYYEQITKNMVGRVLTKNHEVAEKDGNDQNPR